MKDISTLRINSEKFTKMLDCKVQTAQLQEASNIEQVCICMYSVFNTIGKWCKKR